MLATAAVDQYLRHLSKSASASTLRQRRWALDRLLLAAAVASLAGSPTPTGEQVATIPASSLALALAQLDIDQVLDPQIGPSLVELSGRADVVSLRWGVRSDTPSAAAHRARAAALRGLAAWLGHQVPAPSEPPPELRTPPPQAQAYQALWLLLQHQEPSPGYTRFTALACTAAALAQGPSKLAALSLDEIEPSVELLPRHLQGSARLCVLRWARHHARLTAALEGSAAAAWVSLAPNHRSNGHSTPPGMPVRPRGLERTWRSHAQHAQESFLATRGLYLPSSLTLWARAFKA